MRCDRDLIKVFFYSLINFFPQWIINCKAPSKHPIDWMKMTWHLRGGAAVVRAGHQVVPGRGPRPLAGPPPPPLDPRPPPARQVPMQRKYFWICDKIFCQRGAAARGAGGEQPERDGGEAGRGDAGAGGGVQLQGLHQHPGAGQQGQAQRRRWVIQLLRNLCDVSQYFQGSQRTRVCRWWWTRAAA